MITLEPCYSDEHDKLRFTHNLNRDACFCYNAEREARCIRPARARSKLLPHCPKVPGVAGADSLFDFVQAVRLEHRHFVVILRPVGVPWVASQFLSIGVLVYFKDNNSTAIPVRVPLL